MRPSTKPGADPGTRAGPGSPRHVIVVADGDVPPRADLDAAWPGWADGVDAVIAADGGLSRVTTAGLEPSMLVGDLDSLEPSRIVAAEASGLPIRRAARDKDESDAELALLEAVAQGATRVTLLGAFGGPRLDHALANLWLLGHPAFTGLELVLLDSRARVSVVSAPTPDGRPVTRHLAGPVGATLSLLPFGGEVQGITTRGLRYPLADEGLVVGPARGLSNVRDAPDAAVIVRRGRLLVVEVAFDEGRLSSRS